MKLTRHTYNKRSRELIKLIDKAKRQHKKRTHFYKEQRELSNRWIQDFYGGFSNMLNHSMKRLYKSKSLYNALTAENPLLKMLKKKGNIK